MYVPPGLVERGGEFGVAGSSGEETEPVGCKGVQVHVRNSSGVTGSSGEPVEPAGGECIDRPPAFKEINRF